MDRGGWWSAVDGVAKSQTLLSTHTHIHHISMKERVKALKKHYLADMVNFLAVSKHCGML